MNGVGGRLQRRNGVPDELSGAPLLTQRVFAARKKLPAAVFLEW
jgi:hypothetical protein